MKRFLFVCLLLIPTSFVSALVEILDPTAGNGGGGILPVPNADGSDVIASIIAYGIGIAWVLWVIAITWAGIQMVFSAGDDEKVKKARYTIIYGLIGVFLAGAAYGIIKFVGTIQL